MKIAVFCPNWVGDLVMATPALYGIRRHFPGAEIVGVHDRQADAETLPTIEISEDSR